MHLETFWGGLPHITVVKSIILYLAQLDLNMNETNVSMLSYFICYLFLLPSKVTKRASRMECSLVWNQINILFIIYHRIIVLSLIRLQSYSIYFVKNIFKGKGKAIWSLTLKRESYTVCSTFEIPHTVNNLGFSYKERCASLCLISPL